MVSITNIASLNRQPVHDEISSFKLCGPQGIRPVPQLGQSRNPHTIPVSSTVSYFGFQGHFFAYFLWGLFKESTSAAGRNPRT